MRVKLRVEYPRRLSLSLNIKKLIIKYESEEKSYHELSKWNDQITQIRAKFNSDSEKKILTNFITKHS